MILNHLASAMYLGRFPESRTRDLRRQDVASFRIFLWTQLAIGKIATEEVEATPDPVLRAALMDIVRFHLHEVWIESYAQPAWKRRANELMEYHGKERDCLVVAEAEILGVDGLLTCDETLIQHLRHKAKVDLIRPSDWWIRLGIQRGRRARTTPRPDNPLSQLKFWHWAEYEPEAEDA